MSLLSPSNHSGQLSEMSLFCGHTLGPPIAFAPTFHCDPSLRLCQWQKPHDFCPSSEYADEKSQRSPASSPVAKRFLPCPPFTGSGVDGVTPTGSTAVRVSLPSGPTARKERSSVCMLATKSVLPSGDATRPCGVMPPVN